MRQIEIEKLVLGLHHDRYLVNVFHTFQGKDYLYFVMEHMSNGSLSDLIEKEGRLH